MSIKPTIPDQYLPSPCGTSPLITICTPYTGFMFLILEIEHAPTKWEWKEIRGKLRRCRAHWELSTFECLPQVNPEGNRCHTFALPTRPIGTKIYFILSTECSQEGYIPATPPIVYTYKDCPPGGAYIRICEGGSTLIASTSDMSYVSICDGNPAAKVNNLTLKALQAGPYYFEAEFIGRADPNAAGQWTGHAKLTRQGGGIFATGPTVTSDRGQEITLHVQGTIQANANWLFTSGWSRTAGTSLLQIPQSLNAGAYFLMQPI